MLTDGFAFRLLLATERDAAMQQMALEMAGECPGGQGPVLVLGSSQPCRARWNSTREVPAGASAPPCTCCLCMTVGTSAGAVFTPRLLPSPCCTGASRLAVEEDMPLRTWHQGAIAGGHVCRPSCLLGLPHCPHAACCLVVLAM